jgi:PAT family beta-lactamase induction signal transducer AmpG
VPADRLFDARTRTAVLLLGFASGLPADLIGGTFQSFLADAGLKPKEIGLLALVGLPLMLKPLWAPFVDRWVPPLGRRRGWIALALLGLAIALAPIGFLDPRSQLGLIIACATLVACASATLDLAKDAYTCEVVDGRSAAAGAGLAVWGWRAAALATSWGALALAKRAGWEVSYLAMAGCALLCLGAVAVAREPIARAAPPANLREAVAVPLAAFWRSLGPAGLLAVLAFALFFRLADSWAGNQTGSFLIAAGFDKDAIGFARGPVALLAAGGGVLLAGWLGARLPVAVALLIAGVAGAVSNLGFALIDLGWLSGTSGLYTVIAGEALCGGLMSAVFVGFLMRLCTSSCAATQYALLTSVWLLGRFLTAPAGGIAEASGWAAFFLWSAVAGLPGLALIPLVARHKGST